MSPASDSTAQRRHRWKSPMAAGRIDDPRWDEAPTPPTRVNRSIVSVVVVVLVMVIAMVTLSIRSRVDYGTAAFWTLPNRIIYCGRRYYPTPMPVSGTPASFTALVSGGPRWRTVGRTFWLKPIEGPIARSHSAGGACTMGLYLPLGGNRYRLYGLSGSP